MKHSWKRITLGDGGEVHQCIHCNLLRVVVTSSYTVLVKKTRYYLNGEVRIKSGECKNQEDERDKV